MEAVYSGTLICPTNVHCSSARTDNQIYVCNTIYDFMYGTPNHTLYLRYVHVDESEQV